MCLTSPKSFSPGPRLGSRCPLTPGPPWPRRQVLLSFPGCWWEVLCAGLHVASTRRALWTRVNSWLQFTFLCRCSCAGWRLEAAATDKETMEGSFLRDPTGNLHKLTSLLVCSSAWLPFPSRASVSPFSSFRLPQQLLFPSLPLLPSKVQEDFIPFRELLVFLAAGDDSFTSGIFSGPEHCFPYPSHPTPRKEQKAIFGLLVEFNHPIPYMVWAVVPPAHLTKHFEINSNKGTWSISAEVMYYMIHLFPKISSYSHEIGLYPKANLLFIRITSSNPHIFRAAIMLP